MTDDVYEDYLNKVFELQRPYSIDYNQFEELFLLILKNQTTYFRAIYQGKTDKEINLENMMDSNIEDIVKIFETYDLNKNNFIDYEELRELLIDLGHDN